jgi:hypothetical protein
MLEHAQPTPDEVRVLASQLMSWADRLSAPPARHDADPSDELTREQLLNVATAAREVRRQRTVTFPHLRLREPMWDVMLDLFIEQESGHRMSLDHLTLTGEHEAVVVNHAVAVLVTAGLLTRTPDRFDKRVVWLTLSPAGQTGMIEHFTQAAGYLSPRTPRPVPTARAAA